MLNPIAVAAAGLLVGVQLLDRMASSGIALRPPGTTDEDDFLAKCIKCGKCAQACPYGVIDFEAGGLSEATPTITARQGSCRLCEDFPCIAVCPSGALTPVGSRYDVRMGTALLDRDLCVALRGIRCEVCYRACPLTNEAITISYSLREGDRRHAIFEPVINSEVCVGCGICEERCIIHDPSVAIRVVPRALAGSY